VVSTTNFFSGFGICSVATFLKTELSEFVSRWREFVCREFTTRD
jgi:hypothetical protein